MAEGKLFIEKRKHKRVGKDLHIRYKLVPGSISVSTEKTAGKSGDISIGGVRIVGDVIGKPNDILRVEIDTGLNNSLIFFAQIKWQKEKEFGMEFLTLKEHDREILEELID
jgi:hypothetical protein